MAMRIMMRRPQKPRAEVSKAARHILALEDIKGFDIFWRSFMGQFESPVV
jgi:hypothetical protein